MKVKICGIRRYEDARAALDEGAWALGFIFHPPSPRYISPDEAAAIVRSLPRDTLTVGVFVDDPIEELNSIVKCAGLKGAQLHGSEDLEYAKGVSAELVIKALRVRPGFRPEEVLDFPGSRILLDTFHETLAGGTGKPLDWDFARRAARLAPIILAGGIDPRNIEAALEQVEPDAVDVSSGVEASPGVKDPVKIRSLFEAVRRYEGKERAG